MWMWMAVGVSIVGVLVLMLDVLVLVSGVGVDVSLVLVLVLVGMGGLMCVLVGHGTPFVVWSLSLGADCAPRGASACRCAMWRNPSSSRTATWGS